MYTGCQSKDNMDGTTSELEESFEIVTSQEVFEACGTKQKQHDNRLKNSEQIDGFSETNLDEVLIELRHLEERLYLWQEVRRNTILQLRGVADYLASIGHQTDMVRVVEAGGGLLASGLTVVGGIMTAATSGPATPVLIAAAGIGLVAGVTGGVASVTKTIFSSKPMETVLVAIEVDSAATSDLVNDIEILKVNNFLNKTASMLLSVGCVASGTKGLFDVARGTGPSKTILPLIEKVGPLFGESLNKQIARLLAETSGRVIAGTVTSVFGGVTMLLDLYHLKNGIKQLVLGGQEGSLRIRKIADTLEHGLNDFLEKDYDYID